MRVSATYSHSQSDSQMLVGRLTVSLIKLIVPIKFTVNMPTFLIFRLLSIFYFAFNAKFGSRHDRSACSDRGSYYFKVVGYCSPSGGNLDQIVLFNFNFYRFCAEQRSAHHSRRQRNHAVQLAREK